MELRFRIAKYLLFLSTLMYCIYFGALMLDVFVLVPLHKGSSVSFLRAYYQSPYLPDLKSFFAPAVIAMIISSILTWIIGWKMTGWKHQTIAMVTSVIILLMLIFIFTPINLTPIENYTDEELISKFGFWMNANWIRITFVFLGLLYSARALNSQYIKHEKNQ